MNKNTGTAALTFKYNIYHEFRAYVSSVDRFTLPIKSISHWYSFLCIGKNVSTRLSRGQANLKEGHKWCQALFIHIPFVYSINYSNVPNTTLESSPRVRIDPEIERSIDHSESGFTRKENFLASYNCDSPPQSNWKRKTLLLVYLLIKHSNSSLVTTRSWKIDKIWASFY